RVFGNTIYGTAGDATRGPQARGRIEQVCATDASESCTGDLGDAGDALLEQRLALGWTAIAMLRVPHRNVAVELVETQLGVHLEDRALPVGLDCVGELGSLAEVVEGDAAHAAVEAVRIGVLGGLEGGADRGGDDGAGTGELQQSASLAVTRAA